MDDGSPRGSGGDLSALKSLKFGAKKVSSQRNATKLCRGSEQLRESSGQPVTCAGCSLPIESDDKEGNDDSGAVAVFAMHKSWHTHCFRECSILRNLACFETN